MCVNIRSFGSGDAEAVREVHLKAFTGRENEARLVESLHAEDAGPVSLAAVDSSSGGVVGHVLFSPAEIDNGGSSIRIVGLAPSECCRSTRGKASRLAPHPCGIGGLSRGSLRCRGRARGPGLLLQVRFRAGKRSWFGQRVRRRRLLHGGRVKERGARRSGGHRTISTGVRPGGAVVNTMHELACTNCR